MDSTQDRGAHAGQGADGVVQEQTGHPSEAITLGIYAGILYAQRREGISGGKPGQIKDHARQLGLALPESEKAFWSRMATAGLEERVPAWLKPALGADWMGVVTGVHEMAQVTDRVAVLLQPELLGVARDDSETEVALMSLEGNLHGAFGWPDETTLRLGLLTPESVDAFEGKGYRVIRVIQHPESEETPLPWPAVPVVVAEALAGGRPTFWVNVTPYLNLKGITLPEILATLTNLFA